MLAAARQTGFGFAQIADGEWLEGGSNVAFGMLGFEGARGVRGTANLWGDARMPKYVVPNATLIGPRLESPVSKLLYGERVGEGLPGAAGFPIVGRPSIIDMENLTAKHGVEFAVTYKLGPGRNGGGGQYFLHSGEAGSVNFPKEADRMLINHTHPGINGAGGARYASEADMQVLEYLKGIGSPQRSSMIIPVERDVVVRFGGGRDLSAGTGALFSEKTTSIWIPRKP